MAKDGFIDSLENIPLGDEISFPKELFLEDEGEPSPEEQSDNMSGFDLPVPGQGFTGEPGQAKYEQPPQYTNLSDAANHIYTNLVRQDVLDNVLTHLDKGVPVSLMAEPIIMHGVQEGFYTVDLAMQLMEPVMIMLGGLGRLAGIPVRWEDKDDNLRPKQTKEKPVELKPKGILQRPQKQPGNAEPFGP